MSVLIPVNAYLPLFTSLVLAEEEHIQQQLLESRATFLSNLSPFLEARNDCIRNVSVTYCSPPENVTTWLNQKSWFNQTRMCDHVVVSANVAVDVDLLKKLNNTDDIEEDFISHCAAYDLSNGIEDALFLSEVAFPGCITTLDGIAISPHSNTRIRSKNSFSTLLFLEEDDPSWPPLSMLDLLSALLWARSVGFGQEAFASSKIARALAAFSHAVNLSHHREGEVLFRAMQGLEAFYCEGTGDLRRQLSEKVRIWIGPWNDKRNIIGHLYDVRSAFVHGGANIEYYGHHIDSWAENEKAKNEHSFSSTFAVRLLLSTLQKCVKEKVTDVVWKFNVEPTSR